MFKKFSQKLSFKNPVILVQASEAPFIADRHIGHTMPKGKDFIGELGYLSLEDAIAFLKKNKKEVILNVGDSSTSGWDSNVITLNRERMKQNLSIFPAFFRYKTYSDFLRDNLDDNYYVINAGVPAHTSFQGYFRLNSLLNRFKKEGIPIKLVTLYFGNNDSVWDHNRQDKEWVGKRNEIVFLKQLFKRFKEHSSIITRVSPDDFKMNMKKMVRICQDHDTEVVIIEPLTPLYWKPGTRVHNEELEKKYFPGAKIVYKLLDEALFLWAKTQQTPYSELKEALLEEVREKDFIVPRIKKDYLFSLRALGKELNVPYIQVHLDRTEDDIRFFIDYCHPIGIANQLIAEKIKEVISGKVENLSSQESPSQDFLCQNKPSEINLAIPENTYTLY